MEYNILEYKKIEELGTVIRGVRLGSKDRMPTEETSEKVKLLNWMNLKKASEGKSLDEVPYTSLDFGRKQKKDSGYVQKGDIVFPIFPFENAKNIIYIEEAPKEKCVYSETVFVLRITDPNINSKYVYMILNSKFFANYLLELASNGGRVLRYRLTAKILQDIKIPILDENGIKALLDENLKVQAIKEEAQRQCDNLDNKINKIATYGNGLKINI